MTVFGGVFDGLRILLTGHTGFKGGWLALWLAELGAEVHGFALEPPSSPNLFTAAGVNAALTADVRADLCDAAAVRQAMAAARPEIVLHLAAQPIVRRSYREPLETFAVNVMGTAHVLEAARAVKDLRAAVCITTDKCYENREWHWSYREGDALGGRDPYAASKAAAELVIGAWRSSFFPAAGIASARAGNVIGGGDWGEDRLLPDLMRGFAQGATVEIRSPQAIRPWQHVLDCLAGYLLLAQGLCAEPARFAGAWNFGPDMAAEAPVLRVAETARTLWGAGAAIRVNPPQDAPHEATFLKLDSAKARAEIGWRPLLSLDKGLGLTVTWHRAQARGEDVRALTTQQIRDYMDAHAENARQG